MLGLPPCQVLALSAMFGYLLASGMAIAAHDPMIDPSSYDATIELSAAISGMDDISGRNRYCGYGMTIGYPWKDHALLEAEYTRYFDHYGRPRRSVFVAGVRVGIRRRMVGVFAKLQPGVSRDAGRGSKLALAAGGVLEIFLFNRVYTRLDVDTLMVWLRNATSRGVPVTRSGMSRDVRVSIGMGFRF